MRALALVCGSVVLLQLSGCLAITRQQSYRFDEPAAGYRADVHRERPEDPLVWVPVEGTDATLVMRSNQLGHRWLSVGYLLPVIPLFANLRDLGGEETVLSFAVSHPTERMEIDWSRVEVVSEHVNGESQRHEAAPAGEWPAGYLGSNIHGAPPARGWISAVGSVRIENRGGIPVRLVVRVPESAWGGRVVPSVELALKLRPDLRLELWAG